MIPRRKIYLYPEELIDIERQIRVNDEDNAEIITAWEKSVAQYINIPYTTSVSSGRRGLDLILRHLGVGPGDEVIIPAYTLKDLIPLVQNTGAGVIPADIDPETLNISPESITRRITLHTKAILALHAFGAPCAIETIAALADKHGVPVIEDCAHSLGAAYMQQQTGSFGYASFFSFETTKPVNTFGGGMVASRDKQLIENIQMDTDKNISDSEHLRKKVQAVKMEQILFSTVLGYPLLYLLACPRWKNHISRLYRRLQHAPPPNIRYLPIQAALGLKKIKTLDKCIRLRKEKACLLRSLLKPEIRVQGIGNGCESTWYFFVAILPCESLDIRRKLLLHGIDAGIEDEITDNCAALLGYNDCPNVNSIYHRAIVLPLYESISEEEIQKIAGILNRIVP